MASWEFPSTEPIDLHIDVTSGSVAITAAPTEVVTVSAHRSRPGRRPHEVGDNDEFDGDLEVEFSDGRLEVEQTTRHGLHLRSTDVHLVISVPENSHCTARTMSASLACDGVLGSLDAQTASGSVEASTVRGPLEVTTMSGKVRVNRADSEASLQSASGKIQVRHAGGDLVAGSASGEITVDSAEGSVSVKTASGRIRIGSIARGHAELNSVSGDVEVKVAPGTGVYLDLGSLTGRVTSDLEPSDQDGDPQLHLYGRTVSGSLRVARAAPAEMAS